MATAARDTSDEGQIRGLFDGWLTALRAKDVNGRTAGYAADVVVFDVINPMQHVGLDGLRKRLEKWFSTFTSPIDCEMRDLSIAAGRPHVDLSPPGKTGVQPLRCRGGPRRRCAPGGRALSHSAGWPWPPSAQ